MLLNILIGATAGSDSLLWLLTHHTFFILRKYYDFDIENAFYAAKFAEIQ